MIQSYMRIILGLLIVGLIILGSVALQPTVARPIPQFTHLVSPVNDGTPVPAVLRGFDGDRPVGLSLLDERAEVLFDH